jgi:cobalt-zinc-cadmium efflux system outer membrane protein
VRFAVVKLLPLVGLPLLVGSSLAFSQPAEQLSLKEAIDIALQQNPEVIGARRGIDAARGRFWQGISLPPPTLSVGYDYIPLGSGISRYDERAVGISQSFDFPSTIVLRGSSLSSEIDAAESDTRSLQLSVTMEVKLAYFAVLSRQQKLQLAEENFRVAEDVAGKAEIRLNAGEGTNLENLTAKVQRTQALNDVELARNELRVATSELDLVLGRGIEHASREYVLTDTLSHRPYAFALESLIGYAQQSNPQLQSVQSRLSAASTRRTIAWSSILPSFTVSYARQAQAGNQDLYGVSFGVSLPIWFLFDHRGRIQEATAEYARVESDLTAKRLGINRGVKVAYLQFTNDERQIRLYATDLLPQAEEVFRIASRGYLAGETAYIALLLAQQTLISVRRARIDALYNYSASLARLEYAVGRELAELPGE